MNMSNTKTFAEMDHRSMQAPNINMNNTTNTTNNLAIILMFKERAYKP